MTAKNNMRQTAEGRKREELQKAASIVREAKRAADKAARILAEQAKAAALAQKPLTEEQIEEIVNRTVLRTLSNLGIRAHTDEDVDELRKDFAYTRAWRQTIQKSTKTGWLTFITVATTGFLGVLYIAIRIAILGHP